MTFANPLLLWSLAGLALPLVIHWLLRPRPRRVRFPAVRMLHAALSAGQRAQRLTHWRLLAVRCAFLALLAVLLAGPRCGTTAAGPLENQPRSGVLVLDESWSTQLEIDSGRTLWQVLRDEAVAQAAAAARDWPAGSELGWVSTSAERAPVAASVELAWVADGLRRMVPAAAHAATLRGALEGARQMLERSRPGVRELVVCSDGAAHAWRDVPEGVLGGVEGLRVRFVAPRRAGLTNLSLEDVRGPPRAHPESLPLPLRVRASAAGLAAETRIVVRADDRVLLRSEPLRLPVDEPVEATWTLPPLDAGLHVLTIDIEPPDRLAFDQRRFAVVSCGPRPAVWLIDQEVGEARDADLTGVLLQNLLAPEGLPPERQPLALQRRDANGLETSAPSGGDPPALIVLPPTAALSEIARGRLDELVQGGATLLLAAGGGPHGACDWPGVRRWLASEPPVVEPLTPPASMRWSDAFVAEAGRRTTDELGRCVVKRRLRLAGLSSDVTVLASYVDEAPAVIQQRRGRGRVLLLTTSPDPAWSDLGVRAAGLLAWMHGLVQGAGGPADASFGLRVGESADTPLEGLAGRRTVQVRTVAGDGGIEPREVTLLDGRPRGGWPTDQPGGYEVWQGGQKRAAFVVNWPAEESDLRAITTEELAARLGVAKVEWVTAETGLRGGDVASGAGLWNAWRRAPLDLMAGLGLLMLLLWEQVLSRRAASGSERIGPD